MDTPTQAMSPQVLKKVEKQIAKEGKAEEARLQHAMKDLSVTEKEEGKMHKAVEKAESAISKLGKKEIAATEAMHKATHKHDIATTNLHGAERDAEMKKQVDIKLKQELDVKKANIEAAIKEQQAHKQDREAKLAELRSGSGTAANTAEAAATGGGIAGGAGVMGHRQGSSTTDHQSPNYSIGGPEDARTRGDPCSDRRGQGQGQMEGQRGAHAVGMGHQTDAGFNEGDRMGAEGADIGQPVASDASAGARLGRTVGEDTSGVGACGRSGENLGSHEDTFGAAGAHQGLRSGVIHCGRAGDLCGQELVGVSRLDMNEGQPGDGPGQIGGSMNGAHTFGQDNMPGGYAPTGTGGSGRA